MARFSRYPMTPGPAPEERRAFDAVSGRSPTPRRPRVRIPPAIRHPVAGPVEDGVVSAHPVAVRRAAREAGPGRRTPRFRGGASLPGTLDSRAMRRYPSTAHPSAAHMNRPQLGARAGGPHYASATFGAGRCWGETLKFAACAKARADRRRTSAPSRAGILTWRVAGLVRRQRCGQVRAADAPPATEPLSAPVVNMQRDADGRLSSRLPSPPADSAGSEIQA